MRGKIGWFIALGGIGMFLLSELQAQTTTRTTTGTGSTTTGGGIGTGGGGIGAGSGVGTNRTGSLGGGQGMTGGGLTGGQGMTGGGSFIGQVPQTATTGQTKGSATATGIPAASNVFKGSYANPLSLGVTAGAKATFGQPLHAVVTTTTTTRTTPKNANSAATSTGFNTFGQDRDAPFTTDLGETLPLVVHPEASLEAHVKSVVERSATLKSSTNIRATVEDGVVVLRGRVASPGEKRLAESMLRLSPGVRIIRNELTVGP